MKDRLKNFLLATPGFQGLCRQLTRHHVRALMYHRFSPAEEASPQHPDAELLHEQMQHLVDNHVLWHPDNHLARLQGSDIAGKCPVVVTIDDGYWDFYKVAYPVFRELKIPAMLFITTAFVDGDNWFWWDRLAYIFNNAQPTSLEFSITDRNYLVDLHSTESKNRAWNQIADRCRFITDTEKEAVLSDLAKLLAVEVPATAPQKYSAVTWDQVRKMEPEGIFFGAHTLTHPILSRVPLEEAQKEIAVSGQVLNENLSEPTKWFCYPQGGPADFTTEVRNLVAEAKFSGCYVAYQDLENPDDPFIMPRYCVGRDMTEFKWTLCGAEYIFLKLNQRLGRSTGPGATYWSGSN